MCGGTVNLVPLVHLVPGLSPRVRGNRSHTYSGFFLFRSIPACAGEPRTCIGVWCVRAVYPRVCGGTISADCMSVWDIGLSPRVRGNQTDKSLDRVTSRSIPACAGEPLCQRAELGSRQVYPRVCGGTFPFPWLVRHRGGLSPRVRGNPIPVIVERLSEGSIPACAGEPGSGRLYALDHQVYPRVCGGTKRTAHGE